MEKTIPSNWHIVCSKEHEGHKCRSIVIDKGKGVKAIYCQSDNKIVKMLFKKSRGWESEQALDFTKKFLGDIGELSCISVDQEAEFLKVILTKRDGETMDLNPNSPSFVFSGKEEIPDDEEIDLEKGGVGSGNWGHFGREGERGGSMSTINPETELSPVEKWEFDRLKPSQKKDYLQHRNTGMEHKFAIALAEPSREEAERIIKAIREQSIIVTEVDTIEVAEKVMKAEGVNFDRIDEKDKCFVHGDMPCALYSAEDKELLILPHAVIGVIDKGGAGSGNFGHAGREGERGGSAPSEGAEAVDNSAMMAQALEAKPDIYQKIGVSHGSEVVRSMLHRLGRYGDYAFEMSTVATLGIPTDKPFGAEPKYPVNEEALKDKLAGKENVTVPPVGQGEPYRSLTDTTLIALGNMPPELQQIALENVDTIKLTGSQGGAKYKQSFNNKTGEITKSILLSKYDTAHPTIAQFEMTHELSHALDYGFNKIVGKSLSDTKEYTEAMLQGGKAITKYALTNEKEHFAEHLTAFAYVPEKLKEVNEPVHKFFTDLFAGKRDYTKALEKVEGKVIDAEELDTVDDFNNSIVQMLENEFLARENSRAKQFSGEGKVTNMNRENCLIISGIESFELAEKRLKEEGIVFDKSVVANKVFASGSVECAQWIEQSKELVILPCAEIGTVEKGGAGSGNFGHAGREGERGGSAPADSAGSGEGGREPRNNLMGIVRHVQGEGRDGTKVDGDVVNVTTSDANFDEVQSRMSDKEVDAIIERYNEEGSKENDYVVAVVRGDKQTAIVYATPTKESERGREIKPNEVIRRDVKGKLNTGAYSSQFTGSNTDYSIEQHLVDNYNRFNINDSLVVKSGGSYVVVGREGKQKRFSKGGQGSGNWGHSGREGERGGSSSEGGGSDKPKPSWEGKFGVGDRVRIGGSARGAGKEGKIIRYDKPMNSFIVDVGEYESIEVHPSNLTHVEKGGAGSGNFGHAGREGERGGSAPSDGGGASGGDSMQAVQGSIKEQYGKIKDEINQVREERGASREHYNDAGMRNPDFPVDYNIKVYGVNIPDVVREGGTIGGEHIEAVSESAIEEIYQQEAQDRIEAFIDNAKSEYPSLNEMGQAGRSGGWLVADFNMQEDRLDENADFAQGADAKDSDIKDYRDSYKQVNQVLGDIQRLDSDVKELVSEFKKDMSSEAWWKERLSEKARKDKKRAELSKGGAGSGNFGHSGRAGERGGSAPSDGGGASASGDENTRLENEAGYTDADRSKWQNDGVKLASKYEWDGKALLEIAGDALEDANFHSEAKAVREMSAKVDPNEAPKAERDKWYKDATRISSNNKWDGHAIAETMGNALEDANFHSEAKAVRDMSLNMLKEGNSDMAEGKVNKGGQGSGNFGHAGREGERGGSAPSDAGAGGSEGAQAQGGQEGSDRAEQNKEVAKTIIQQMGGGRLRAMTGAKDFIAIDNGVRFSIPKAPKDSINRVEITLNGKDLYDMKFGRVRGDTYKVVSQANDIYADQLQSTFTSHTGLETSLGTMGKKKEKQEGKYHRARIVEPSEFDEKTFRTIWISSDMGIKAVVGRLKGEEKTSIQAYLFDTEKWTPEKAKKWLKDHDLKPTEMVEVPKGGEGSGNWGHAGREGERGGSAPREGGGGAEGGEGAGGAEETEHETSGVDSIDNGVKELGSEAQESFKMDGGEFGSDYSDRVGSFEKDGEAYNIIQDEDTAIAIAEEQVRNDLENEPELFNQDFLQNYMSMSETDKNIISGEEADAYVDGMDDDRLIEEGGKQDQMDELQAKIDEEENKDEPDQAKLDAFEKEKEALVDDAREQVRSDRGDYVKEALDKDPKDYFVNELGAYTEEELMKQPFIRIDVESATKDAVATDGWAHFLSRYDGNYDETKSGAVYFRRADKRRKSFKVRAVKIGKSCNRFLEIRPTITIQEKVQGDVSNTEMVICKTDETKRIVYGIFLYPDEADHDGDVISAEDIEKVAHGFMTDYRTIDEMHKDVIEADIVESAIAWQDDLPVYGKKVKKGTWFGAVKVHDNKVWDKVKQGMYKGFSVRISGVREDIPEKS